MPAPKKPQAIKDQTRHRREVRKYRRACRTALGPLGTNLFREFLNLHGRLPIETTACWAEALAQDFGEKGTALYDWKGRQRQPKMLYDYRGQFGGWSQALLHRRLEIPQAAGLCFTVRAIGVRGTLPTAWRGLVLVLYERQTGVLFHDLIRIDDRHPPSGDTVWRALNQAVLRLSTGRWPRVQESERTSVPVTVAFPVDGRKQARHPIFAEAARQARGSGQSIMPRHPTGTTWTVSSFKGLRNVSHTADPYTFLELEKMLREEAKSVTSSLRKFRQRVKSAVRRSAESPERSRRPAWLLLFPRIYPYQFRRSD